MSFRGGALIALVADAPTDPDEIDTRRWDKSKQTNGRDSDSGESRVA
jgi:hypothetical protein